MNASQTTLPPKLRSDVIDTVTQHRDEVWAFKWLLVLLLLTITYEFGQQAITSYALSGIEIREPEPVTARRPLPPKRITRVLNELRKLQTTYPIVRSAVRQELAGLEEVRELRPESLPNAARESRIAGHLERLLVFFSRPTWDRPEVFEPARAECRAILTLLKRPIPEVTELPPLPVGNSRVDRIDLPTRDIFSYGTASGGSME
ncbi:MAG TPA: hypothetical protein PLP29_00630 [Candidatus Ozemobacteraceae bacterium]|nr:hypothetical protein [Candidatus Ozemobacteraceae bacterium]